MSRAALVAFGALVTSVLACKSPGGASRVRDADQIAADGGAPASPDGTGGYPGPPGGTPAGSNFQEWSKYCVGADGDPSALPKPNYDSDLVKSAATKLSLIKADSYALYSQISSMYKGSMTLPPPAGVTPSAHQFLIYLCGEFRDRASMVGAKLNWVASMNFLSGEKQGPMDPKLEPWGQITAESYQPYLALSAAFYQAKREEANQGQKHQFGAATDVDLPAAPVTVCETKFMFDHYVVPQKSFDGLATFRTEYEGFRSANCTDDDVNFYYDFRGDSNIKPNSPESNGMIWHAISVALQCKDTAHKLTTPKYPGQNILLSDADCKSYFLHPFMTRWNGARSGLGAWLLHDRALDPVFHDTQQTVTVTPNWGADLSRTTAKYATAAGPGTMTAGWEAAFLRPDLGLYSLSGAGLAEPQTQQFVYEQVRNSVDRHTDWYASGYDDVMNQKRARTEAYSPFVASSYEMSASDAFTAPCYTVPCNGDVPAKNWKHFMFVFKVAKDRYFSTDDLAKNRQLDFDQNWFDETTFGTTGLAKSERAWDRLGTALESELSTVLYLHHICSDGRIEGPAVKCDQ